MDRAGVFVDCVGGKHASIQPDLLLQKRRMVWRKEYGWCYDAWVDSPTEYSMSGAHGRFSIPALASGLPSLVERVARGTAQAIAQQLHSLTARKGVSEQR